MTTQVQEPAAAAAPAMSPETAAEPAAIPTVSPETATAPAAIPAVSPEMAADPAAIPAVSPETAAEPAAMAPDGAAPAAAAPAAGVFPEKRKFTVAEYYRMTELGILQHTERLELIDGEIIVMAAIGVPHAIGVNRLTQAFAEVARNRFTVSVQNPIHLDDYSEPQPDLALVRLRADSELTSHPGPADTLVAVEVSDSTLAFDLGDKARRYAAAGIQELWVMNLPGDRIDRLDQLGPAGYARHTVFRRGEKISPAALPDLELAIEDLLPPRTTMQGTAGG